MLKVLFLCSENACRSQMAESLVPTPTAAAMKRLGGRLPPVIGLGL